MNKITLLAFFGFLLLGSCQSDADLPPLERYQKVLAEGLASSEVNNNIFLGLELGMTKKGYYDRCTVLNQSKQITMGGGGNAVDYQLKDELPFPTKLTFAPDFGEDKKSVKAMTVLASYDSWSPWNKDSHGPKLLQDLSTFLMKEYGKGFLVVPHDQLGNILVQVKGNRRIAAWAKDERFVQIRFTDLTVRPEEVLGYRVGVN